MLKLIVKRQLAYREKHLEQLRRAVRCGGNGWNGLEESRVGSRPSIEARLGSKSPTLDGSSLHSDSAITSVEALPTSKVAEYIAQSISLAAGAVLTGIFSFDGVELRALLYAMRARKGIACR